MEASIIGAVWGKEVKITRIGKEVGKSWIEWTSKGKDYKLLFVVVNERKIVENGGNRQCSLCKSAI